MKKTVLMLAALVLGSMAFAQNADKKEAVDQYGNTVNVKALETSSRDGILVFESKEKDYKFSQGALHSQALAERRAECTLVIQEPPS